MASINLAQQSSNTYDPNLLYGNYTDKNTDNKSKSVSSVESINRLKNIEGVKATSKQSVADKISSVMAESAQKFMSAVKTNSDILLDALKNMNQSEADSAVNKVRGASSDTGTMTTTNNVSKSNIDFEEPISVNIHQVATAQKNGGNKALNANGNDFSAGSNKFAIDIGGKSYQFSVNNDSRSTNLSVQQQMADSINKKNIGLNAYVDYDSESKKSNLVVESLETGKNENASSVFVVRDVAGNAARTSGIDTITQNAQNAKYSIGDSNETLTSRSNNVNIADGLNATLRKPTTEGNPVVVEVTKDTTSIMNAAKDVVNGYNMLYDTANKMRDSGASRLAGSLNGLAKSHKKSLNEIGISLNAEGHLNIDNTKLKAASENGKLESFFNTNTNSSSNGFISKLERTASAANDNPSDYLSSKAQEAISRASSYHSNTNESHFKNALNLSFNPRNNNLMALGSFYETAF